MIIKIKNFRLKTIVGCHDWEKNIDREIIINVEIESDFDKALSSDNIEDTIDYESLSEKIKNLIATNRFALIEKMAQEVMNLIMEDKRIKKCKLEIDKVGAVEGIESFSVTLIANANGS